MFLIHLIKDKLVLCLKIKYGMLCAGSVPVSYMMNSMASNISYHLAERQKDTQRFCVM